MKSGKTTCYFFISGKRNRYDGGMFSMCAIFAFIIFLFGGGYQS